jgi:hypothetical protein
MDFRAREPTIIFDSTISPRISRDYSEDSIGPGVSGVTLSISRYGVGEVADFWGYGAASEEEEEGSESIIIYPSSRFSLINPSGGIISNIRILRVVITFIFGSPSFRESKKIASLKITFFLGRTSSY